MRLGFFNSEVRIYDVLALERDSNFWAEKRPIQLNEKGT